MDKRPDKRPLTPTYMVFLLLFAPDTWRILMGFVISVLLTPEIVPPDLMGAYSGLRLILLSAGGMISMPVVGYLLQTAGPSPVFAVGAAGTVFMGFAYWRGFRRHRPAAA